MKKATVALLSIISGFINGAFGSGGGMLSVFIFEKQNKNSIKAHAKSVAFIFILSIISSLSYFINGNLDFKLAATFIPYGIIGSILGALLLNKISGNFIKATFAIVILISGIKGLIM